LPKGYNETDTREVQKRVDEALRNTFRPEFLNRIDDIIIFRHLNVEELTQIVDIQAGELAARLAFTGIGLRLEESVKVHLAEVGYDKNFGARPLKRAIQRELETPLSKRLLSGDVKAGDTIVANFTPEEGTTFTVEKTATVSPDAVPAKVDTVTV
jgi:ATP-dependent Clp protease ATP-binding subunit ClpA